MKRERAEEIAAAASTEESRLAAWLFVREQHRPPHQSTVFDQANYILAAKAALQAIETGDPLAQPETTT